MPTFASRLALTVSFACLVPACHDDEHTALPPDAGVDAAPPDLFRSTTTIDLHDFREHAVSVLGALGVTDFDGARIAFVDGAASIDDPPAYDQARLYFLVPAPIALSPDPTFQLAYYVALQGYDATVWAKLRDVGADVAIFGGTATFVGGTSAEHIHETTESLRAQFPMSTISGLDAIGVLTFEGSTPAEETAIYRSLSLDPTVATVELDSEAYRIPFAFASPHKLSDGITSELVDLVSLTTVTRDLRAQGVQFSTEPHLPPPFGM